MILIDGKEIADKIEESLKKEVALFKTKPGLAFILVGENPASRSYIKMKKKACEKIGITSIDKELPSSIKEIELLEEIERLNKDPSIHGILVQLPLPPHITTAKIVEAINPKKDVDGFHPLNVGKVLLGEKEGFFPCTPLGVVTLLEKCAIITEGKHVVIVGRSNIVGKPLAAMLMQKEVHANATVTVVHSYSEHLKQLSESADILIAAIGKPHFITKDMVKKGAVVIDVGINRVFDKENKPHIVGDVDFENVAPLTSYITPVPGGVGPMTIAMLMSNTILSYKRSHL